MKPMPYDKDIGAFDSRAGGYESGWLGRLHHDIADKVADIALHLSPAPARVLDVGCGTGYLLRQLAIRLPDAAGLVGVDPAPQMVKASEQSASDVRLSFHTGVAEALAFQNESFDMVVSTTSFDHWADQRAGLAEVSRVLKSGGHLVLADLFSVFMVPTLLFGHRGRVRTIGGLTALLRAGGFDVLARHNLYVVVQAVSARKHELL